MVGTGADAGYCLFLAERVLELVPRLLDEVDGVRRGGDIEHVHRMRVTSRRLRAVLPLLASCVGRRELRRWRREVRSITRALGAARDADVQIDYLRSYAAGLPGGAGEGLTPGDDGGTSGARMGEPRVAEAPEAQAAPSPARFASLREWLHRRRGAWRRRRSPVSALAVPDAEGTADQGIACLLLRLEQERDGLQPVVLAALDRLEASGVPGEMARWARSLEVRFHRKGVLSLSADVYEAAHLNTALSSDGLLRYAAAIREPDRASDHHAMRIAAKRLRYTLEIFAPLFDDGLKAELKVLKRLQEALGNLHDCDVWIERLPVFLEEERARTLAYFGNDGFFRFIEPGVRRYLEDRKAARGTLHAAALAIWEELERDVVIDRLRERLAVARDEELLPPLPLRSIAEGTGTTRIALIADIHANLPALEAVARDAVARGAQAFVNAGDSVGPGGDPDEVVRRLVALGSVDIRGGSDWKAVRSVRRGAPDRQTGGPGDEPPVPGWVAYLQGLPAERRFALRGVAIRVVHRLTADERHEVRSRVGDTGPGRLSGPAGTEIVVLGHPRRRSARSWGGVHYISPGSLGRSAAADGSTVAEYAFLQLFPFDLAFVSVPYGESTAHAQVESAGGGE